MLIFHFMQINIYVQKFTILMENSKKGENSVWGLKKIK